MFMDDFGPSAPLDKSGVVEKLDVYTINSVSLCGKEHKALCSHFEKEAAFKVVYIGYLFFTLRKLFGTSRYIQLAAPGNLV